MQLQPSHPHLPPYPYLSGAEALKYETAKQLQQPQAGGFVCKQSAHPRPPDLTQKSHRKEEPPTLGQKPSALSELRLQPQHLEARAKS